ncbi:hypothetical protein DIPPA_30623 [Diplonema papillatum]|nr:hypothetical protein DIPPA_30617 [Diplonema papillatum]KAJ9443378.1 hypothetical protein DIPPA_30623 [Diplonema papillatum]
MDHHGSVSPPRRFGSPDQFGGAVDADPTYEPIIGGHKSFSWEKELRERERDGRAERRVFREIKAQHTTAPKRQTPSEGFF